ncbi:MAG: hypothetical protein SGI86_13280 [Deltaproteobacteria bacterium]|nr:hypothetical protein [Deltaproteobacteria bacterium]
MTDADQTNTPVPPPSTPAQAAFEKGDWKEAGRLAREQAADGANPDAQAAAQALLRALGPDPWVVRFAIAALGLLIVVVATYLM